ncbi:MULTISPECIES: TIGR01906 family membrane protein [Streptococcus]|uniref:TIGR01906 family membrane protein n=1 Tax=Streptococcus TaxID=1301 RepID=UPI001C2E9E73|nr:MULTISPECIES: TIGR01906 family membrane protein [Streptococcus]MCD1276930.1 membrane protein [Streptococcus sinensis]MCY7217928.1 TIGR01906 family membrane protein [Streptococcus cristatus]
MRDKVRFSASVLCLLAVAILLTIYLAWLLYPMEISYFNLPDKVYLKSETIQYNFNILMNYLTNPFSQKLAMPDFRSSAAGLYHFQAVKYLFHLAQAVFLLTLPALIFFIKKVVKKRFLALYQRSLFILSVLPFVMICLAGLIGFNSFFTLFHQVLFMGDNTWLFDPAKDPVIWILPEEFFMHAFILFALLYEGIFLTLYFLSRKGKEQT